MLEILPRHIRVDSEGQGHVRHLPRKSAFSKPPYNISKAKVLLALEFYEDICPLTAEEIAELSQVSVGYVRARALDLMYFGYLSRDAVMVGKRPRAAYRLGPQVARFFRRIPQELRDRIEHDMMARQWLCWQQGHVTLIVKRDWNRQPDGIQRFVGGIPLGGKVYPSIQGVIAECFAWQQSIK